MTKMQTGILADVPAAARYVLLQLRPEGDPREALGRLAETVVTEETVVGIGSATVSRLGAEVVGLREPTAFQGVGLSVPATPAALWLWLRGSDRGELIHRSRSLRTLLAPDFEVQSVVDAFNYADGRDLTGYVDGTENPVGDAAIEAARVDSATPGLDGSSFVAVQRWQHDLARFQRYSATERDDMIGRRQSDDEELSDAPPSAHVKRTAQEAFEPAAFVLRRSMPWADETSEGLFFVAFGRSFDAFEAQLRRMVGLDDGITDALFRFTRPLSTSYFWCPPTKDDRLDLSALVARA